MGNSEWIIRLSAVEALGRFGKAEDRVIEVLLKALVDSD